RLASPRSRSWRRSRGDYLLLVAIHRRQRDHGMPGTPVPRCRSRVRSGEFWRERRNVGLVVEDDLANLADAVVGRERLDEVQADDVLDRTDVVCDREDSSDIEAIIDVDLVAAERRLDDHPQRLQEVVHSGDRRQVAVTEREVAVDKGDARAEDTRRNAI